MEFRDEEQDVLDGVGPKTVLAARSTSRSARAWKPARTWPTAAMVDRADRNHASSPWVNCSELPFSGERIVKGATFVGPVTTPEESMRQA